ncbi:MAG: hypothetical protein ACREYC_06905, partial [Gammaproteobacteria bacterium]
VLGILMYFNIHSGSCAPAERDLPSLTRIFSQALNDPHTSKARLNPAVFTTTKSRRHIMVTHPGHTTIAAELNGRFFFAPTPWEPGTNENTNGIAATVLPETSRFLHTL